MYEATAICTYCAGQRTPFTKHVRIQGIGNNNNDDDDVMMMIINNNHLLIKSYL